MRKINNISINSIISFYEIPNTRIKKVLNKDRIDRSSSSKIFNVRNYGAKGDSVTDDTLAIRNTINAAQQWVQENPEEIGQIYIPTGTYEVSPQISDLNEFGYLPNTADVFNISQSNIRLYGDGSSNSILDFKTIDPYTFDTISDPEITWTVAWPIDSYHKTNMGNGFGISSTDDNIVNNVYWEGLRIRGNAMATGVVPVGGKMYRTIIHNNKLYNVGSRYSLEIDSSVIQRTDRDGGNPAKHGYSDGDLIWFYLPPSELEFGWTKLYYVVSSTDKTFYVSETLGGDPITLADTALGIRIIAGTVVPPTFSDNQTLRFGYDTANLNIIPNRPYYVDSLNTSSWGISISPEFPFLSQVSTEYMAVSADPTTNSFITSGPHTLSAGNYIVFDYENQFPSVTLPSGDTHNFTRYYLVSSTTVSSFKIKQGWSENDISINDTGTGDIYFHAEVLTSDGDGWIMDHKAIAMGAGRGGNYNVIDCHLDQWRGEIIHGGGDNLGTLYLDNSLLEYCNASCVSCPAVDMRNTTIQYVYNGTENFSRQPHHQQYIENCTFRSSETAEFAEKYAIAFLGFRVCGLSAFNNTFIGAGWNNSLFLSDKASNVWFKGNQDLGGGGIVITSLNLYPNDAEIETRFENILIEDNHFWNKESGNRNLIYHQFGDIPNNNYIIRNNTMHPNITTGRRWTRVIEDICGVITPGNRDNFRIYGNNLSGCEGINTMSGDYKAIRALWYDNEYFVWPEGSGIWGFDKYDVGVGPREWRLVDEFTGYNSSALSADGWIDLYLPAAVSEASSFADRFPEGFTTTVYCGTLSPDLTKAGVLISSYPWNSWNDPLYILQGQSETFEVRDGVMHIQSQLLTESTFNVSSYGAIGDGITDDTVAIRAAITDAETWADVNTPNVATVKFNSGTYRYAPIDTTELLAGGATPGVFTITTDNIKLLGNGYENTELEFRYIGNTDPSTNWYTVGDGQSSGFSNIRRGGAIVIDEPTTQQNITIEGIHFNGGCMYTGDDTTYGTRYECSSDSGTDVVTCTGHTMVENDLISFGNTAPAELTPNTQMYYAINVVAGTSFQVATTASGSVIELSTVASFYVTNGAGWDSSHKGIFDAGAEGLVIQSCKFSKWRGEMILGNDFANTVSVLDSVFEDGEANCITCPNSDIRRCTFTDVRAALENKTKYSYQKAWFIDCNVTANLHPNALHGISLMLGSDASGGKVTGCNITGPWGDGIILNDTAYNLEISGNTISNTGTPITISDIDQYGGLDKSYGNISITNNTFHDDDPTGGDKEIIYTQFSISNENFVISGNSATTNTGLWTRVIEDLCGSDIVERDGFRVHDNDWSKVQQGMTSTSSPVRANWYNNQWPVPHDLSDKFQYFSTGSGTFSPRDDFAYARLDSVGNIDLELSEPYLSNPENYFLSGFTTEIENGSDAAGKTITLLSNAAWNTFGSNIVLDKGDSVTLQFNGTKFDDISTPATISPLLSSLYGYWKLEDATDSHSTNDLTTVGTPTSIPAVSGNGYDYSGTSHHETNWLPTETGDPFTISYWQDPDTSISEDSGVGRYQVPGSCYISCNGGANEGRPEVGLYNKIGIRGSAGQIISGQWNHILLVYDGGSNFYLFVNGVRRVTETGVIPTTVIGTFDIGGIDGYASLRGKYDEFAIWNRALSHGTSSNGDTATGEVGELYNLGTGKFYDNF